MSATVVAIDLGTNTFLMLVARRAAGGGVEVVEDHCRTPRLGAGLATSASLLPASIERGLVVLHEFAARLQALELSEVTVRAVGTAALRRATNAAEFIERARRECGIEIEVLAEQDEARLGWQAVSGGRPDERLAVVDVGGGSTEVAADNGRSRCSVPIGAVVTSERFGLDCGEAAWSDERWSALNATLERECAVFEPRPAARVVALGGTGANLAALEGAFERFDPALAEGRRVRASSARSWAELLRRRSARERLEFGIERERAQILPAGLACLAAVLERLGCADASVSGRGLRFGLAAELLTIP